MRSEIINALFLREASYQRTTMEKWICDEEEGALIPRGKETPNKIEGHELRDNETPTLNMAIRGLTYTGRKWIADPDPIKVQLEWHILMKTHDYIKSVRTLCNGCGAILMRVKEAKSSLSSNSRLDWVTTF